MISQRGQAVLGPRHWSSSHCLLSLRLAQHSQGLGAVQWRVSSLGGRASSSVSAPAKARVIKLFKEAESAILSRGSKNEADAPEYRAGTRRPAREPEALGSSEPYHVDGQRLSPEQAEVVELAARGQNIFYTGSAGCGKSTVLRAMVQRLTQEGKRVKVMAPTGRAALAINGTTTWSFAGWTPNSHKLGIEDLKAVATRKKSAVRRRFRRTDVVIIDEISMVENLHFERLNQVMKAARHKRGYPAQQYPFGGVQVIVTGDFAQLPPVRPFRHCIECGSEMQLGEGDEEQDTYHCGRCNASHNDGEKWAFRSKAWEECNFAHVYLSNIHRQRDADFISLLNKCRLGEAFTPEEVSLLMNHETNTTGAVELYSTREEVRLVNERSFRKLVAKSHSFQCRDTFLWNREDHPHLEGRGEKHADGSLKSLDEHSMDRLVELKSGMPVVLLVNLDLRNGLCNGSQGIVVGWTAPDRGETMLSPSSSSQAGLKEREVKYFEKAVDEPVWPIVRFSNGIERAIRAECQINELGDEESYSLLCRTQIPLTPAWALSIHRAQGMTLDKVKVDVSKAFADGQVYVALSRVTSLQGLQIVGNARGLAVGVGGNKEVRSFYKNRFGL